MLSVPERLRALTRDLLKRLRLGLDVPSRQEMLALADRIEAVGQQLEMLEKNRASDAEAVKTLRREVKKRKPPAKKPTVAKKAGKVSKKPTKAARPKTKPKKKSS